MTTNGDMKSKGMSKTQLNQINSDPSLPLNERPVTVKNGVLANNETLLQTVASNLYDAGRKLAMSCGNNEIFMFHSYLKYSSDKTQYTIKSYDGSKEITLMSVTANSNAHNTSYIGRDKTNNNVYFSISANGDVFNMSSLLFTTLISPAYYFYAKSPSFIYATGTILKIKDLGLNTETTISGAYVKNNLIWDHDEYIYFVGSEYDVFRLNANTLEIENLTLLNNFKKVKDVKGIVKNANGGYVGLYVGDVLKYIVTMPTGFVDEVECTLSLPKYLPDNAYVYVDAGLVIIDEYLMNMYSTTVGGSSSSISLFINKKKVKSVNDKKSNIILKKGEIFLSTTKLNKFVRLCYVPCENEYLNDVYKNVIEEDGIYSTDVIDTAYTVI